MKKHNVKATIGTAAIVGTGAWLAGRATAPTGEVFFKDDSTAENIEFNNCRFTLMDSNWVKIKGCTIDGTNMVTEHMIKAVNTAHVLLSNNSISGNYGVVKNVVDKAIIGTRKILGRGESPTLLTSKGD